MLNQRDKLRVELNSDIPHHRLWDFIVEMAVSIPPSLCSMELSGQHERNGFVPDHHWPNMWLAALLICSPWDKCPMIWFLGTFPQSIFMNKLLPYAGRVNWNLEHVFETQEAPFLDTLCLFNTYWNGLPFCILNVHAYTFALDISACGMT